MSTLPVVPAVSSNPSIRGGHVLPSNCAALYERFDLLTASEKVIEWYLDGIRTGGPERITHQDLGQACLNTLMLCHETPSEHCELVSSLLSRSPSLPLEAYLPRVLALHQFARQSLLLIDHATDSLPH